MPYDLTGKTVAILATDGFERSELAEPLKALREAGATVHIVAPGADPIKSWDKTDWGGTFPVDRSLEDIGSFAEYDALVLPGGQINPDKLRVEPRAVAFVKGMVRAKKPIAAICHGPWLLVEAGVVEGLRMTSYPSIRTDLRNAGATVVDEEVVCDQGIVTSRNPDDLPAFCAKLIEEIAEGRHEDRMVA